MKKIVILLLALCLLAAPFALAEPGPVARGDAYSAYTDGQGHLYLTGRANPINGAAADNVVGIDAYRVLFLSPDEFLGTQDLYMIDLESLKETPVAKDVTAACLYDEDAAYCVTGANRRQLQRVDLRTLSAQAVYTAVEPIDRLYRSAEGLILSLADNAGTLLYVEETGRFEAYGDAMPRDGQSSESFEVYLTDGAELWLKSGINYTATRIDENVTAHALLNDIVYYLTRTGSALRLKAYDPVKRTTRTVLTPAVKMKNQLTASGRRLFMLSSDNAVCRVDTQKGTLSVFKRYADLTPYKLPADYNVNGLVIEGMSGQLNVYAELSKKVSKPTFSFIEFESDAPVATPTLRLIDTLKLTDETDASTLLQPAAQYQRLSMGSRGEAVRAIQQPLKDLGYYDYYVDGIFGPRTQAAVRLLQFDLERPVTGVADAQLQRLILSGKLGDYDPYRQLTRGNRGMRVRMMQERLRELGYLADAADGIFGPRTQKAVQLFQYENGLEETPTATPVTLKRLYSDSASPCSSYIDLYPGDTGLRVRELNRRLKELYYLECSPGSTYTAATSSAVRMFQRTAGLRETGYASQTMQRELFADDAPQAPGYIVLSRGDDNERVEKLQRRLRQLNYFSGPVDGYFGRQTQDAVALFQKKVGLRPTGVATVRTQQLLFDRGAPVYVKPTVIGVPDIYVENYDYEEDDVYYVSEDSTDNGFILFSWDVEGSVESYNVRVTDDDGNVCIDHDTTMSSSGVELDTLDFDTVYTLRVKAYPEDGERRHITQAEVSFQRIDEEDDEGEELVEQTVGMPEIVLSTVARTEQGVFYVLSGDVTIDWHAEGDVEEYYVKVLDEGDNLIVDEMMNGSRAVLDTDVLNAGEVYTVSVYAVPSGGDMNQARQNTVRFSVPDVELPEPDPTPEPTPVPEIEELTVPEDEPEVLELPEEELEPLPTFEAPGELTLEEALEETAEDDEEAPEAEEVEAVELEILTPSAERETGVEAAEEAPGETVIEETYDDGSATEPAEEAEATYDEEVEPAPLEEDMADNGDEDDMEIAGDKAGEITIDEEFADDAAFEEFEDAPTGSVAAPIIALDPVASEAGDISYISGDVLTMSWISEGDVAEYRIELLDSDGDLLDARSVTENSLSAYTSAFAPGDVYTLNVTAVSIDGQASETSSVSFAVNEAAEATEAEEAWDSSEEDASQWQDSEEEYQEADADWQNSEEEYQEPEEEGQNSEEEYQEAESNWQESEEEYQEAESNWQEPEEEYQEPEQEWQETEQEWQEPEEEYQESEEEWQEPEEEYQEPEEEYQEPEEEYQEPEEEYKEPEEEWQEPELGWEDAEEEWQESEDDFGSEDEGPEELDDLEDLALEGVTLDEAHITALQSRLVELGWLEAEAYTPGLLDEATLYALSDFQSYCNDTYALELPTVDPINPVVDQATLDALADTMADYSNPEA